MRKAAVILLMLAAAILLFPLPHGGNLLEGVVYEVQSYFAEAPLREQEKLDRERRDREMDALVEKMRQDLQKNQPTSLPSGSNSRSAHP